MPRKQRLFCNLVDFGNCELLQSLRKVDKAQIAFKTIDKTRHLSWQSIS